MCGKPCLGLCFLRLENCARHHSGDFLLLVRPSAYGAEQRRWDVGHDGASPTTKLPRALNTRTSVLSSPSVLQTEACFFSLAAS